MPKKSNWHRHDTRVAALIYQALDFNAHYTDEQIRTAVNLLFPRSKTGIGRIRHGRLLLQRVGVLEKYGWTCISHETPYALKDPKAR